VLLTFEEHAASIFSAKESVNADNVNVLVESTTREKWGEAGVQSSRPGTS